MFGVSAGIWAAVAALVFSVLVTVGAFSAGAYYSRSAGEVERAEQRATAAEHDFAVVRAYIEADARAAQQRATAEAAAALRVNELIHDAISTPDRPGAGWTADERGMLASAYCATRPDHAACVPGAVRNGADATAGSSERAGSLDMGTDGAGGIRALRAPALGLRAGGSEAGGGITAVAPGDEVSR